MLQLTLITDEITQDFEHALQVAQRFGIKNVEIRKVWHKNIALFTDDDLQRMKTLLEQYNMGISVVSSPFAKCVLPGSKFVSRSPNFNRNPTYNLSFFDRLIEISNFLDCNLIRVFNFFKLGSKKIPDPCQTAIDLMIPYVKKAESLGKTLLLENEHVCFADNVANSLSYLDAVGSPGLKLNLDPGNFFSAKEQTIPAAYEVFYTKGLVGHMHVKDPGIRLPLLGGGFGVVGKGKIDYKSLFRQAIDHQYRGYISLETHAHRKRYNTSIQSLQFLTQTLSELK